MPTDEPKACWGLLRRRSLAVPTWIGWLVLLFSGIALALIGLRCIYPFLAVNNPFPGGALVVEGWSWDYTLECVVAEAHRHHYDKIYVTGGPFEVGAALSGYRTHAERGAARLVRMGLSTNEVQAVPAPAQRQDRTYTAAAALRNWWQDHDVKPTSMNLITDGPFARRSRLLYIKALGQGVHVGVTSLPEQKFDPKHWWRTSIGFRTVVDQSIAYFYDLLFFRTHGE